jgi:hypothetical protein
MGGMQIGDRSKFQGYEMEANLGVLDFEWIDKYLASIELCLVSMPLEPWRGPPKGGGRDATEDGIED